jgi:hypothetical protein
LNKWAQTGYVVTIDLSPQRARDLDCKVTTTAKIDYAPSPGPKNTNPGDDQMPATALVPILCRRPPPVPITTCPPGIQWLGDRCEPVRVSIPTPTPTALRAPMASGRDAGR